MLCDLLVLLCEEVGEINLDARGRTRAQFVDLVFVFVFLELDELCFDHLDLFLFTLFLNAQLLLLGGCEIFLQHVDVVRVASEYALIVHDVKSKALVLVLTYALLLILRLISDNFRLGVESIRHSYLNRNTKDTFL